MSAKKPTQKPKGWGKFVSLSNDRGVTLKGVPRFTWPHIPLSSKVHLIQGKGRGSYSACCISLVRWFFFFIELYCPKHGSLPNPPLPPPPRPFWGIHSASSTVSLYKLIFLSREGGALTFGFCRLLDSFFRSSGVSTGKERRLTSQTAAGNRALKVLEE